MNGKCSGKTEGGTWKEMIIKHARKESGVSALFEMSRLHEELPPNIL